MKKYFLVLLSILMVGTSCIDRKKNTYRSEWDNSPDGVWAGPDLWANRLQDWKVEDGSLICINTLPMRTVHLTTFRLGDEEGNITSSIKINSPDNVVIDKSSSAGILIGAGAGLDYRSASLIHHSNGPLAGIYIGLDGQGNLFIKDFEKKNSYIVQNTGNSNIWKESNIIINITPSDQEYLVGVIAIDPSSNVIIDRIDDQAINSKRFIGSIALVSNIAKNISSDIAFSFKDWRVSGSKFEYKKDHNIGPLIGIQYTLSNNLLKLTTQVVPIGKEEESVVDIEIFNEKQWKVISSSDITDFSYVAKFSVEDWIEEEDVPFRLVYRINRKKTLEYFEEGIIKHDPVDKDTIVTLSLSCIEQVLKPERNSWTGIDAGTYPWDWGLLYPHTILTDNLKAHKPDLLFFAGDQVYEGASPTAADRGPLAHLDYLYKWYLWCITYKDLTLVTPSISIPDDHDVYHGNIWGAGGIASPEGARGAAAQDAGGYKMSPEFVNMVQETQTSHLPDPYDPIPVEQGIGVYFTDCNIGGVSFAILEDRKFKSAPKAMLPDGEIVNGWPQNPNWNVPLDSRIEASLLGDRQLVFLEDWADDWSNHTWMKTVLSQTLFANVATLPKESMSDGVVPGLEIPDSGLFLLTDKLVSDFDSNAWPQTGRDRALRLFRKAFATHLAGDQHLGSTVQYGIDSWGDAGYAIVSPATGNIFPRRWHPPTAGQNRKEDWPVILGDFEDGFGNKITVHGVTNPHKSTIEPVRHNELSTGYSVARFIRESRDIELENWPYYAGPGNGLPFPYWPVKFNQIDNYGRSAVAWLPELIIEGMDDPVIRLTRERTEEIVYTLRIAGKSFQPKVFYFGTYTIEIGDPDEGTWQVLEGISATSFKERQSLEIEF
jgi:alkaline phosphatase D